MPQRDFLPQGWTDFAEWMQNFATALPDFADKYQIPAAVLTATRADAKWLTYWVQAKFNAKQQEKQLTDYIDAVADGELGAPPVTDPLWTLPPNPVAAVAPGVRKRVRQLANQIKANPAYSQADGLALGIVGEDEAEIPDNELKPVFEARPLANFALEIAYPKQKADGLRVEYRRENANWQLATILTSSPGVFNVAPANPAQAEQIALRAIYLKKNAPVGAYSDIKTAVIAP